MDTLAAQFTDQRGRRWLLELNYSLAKRLRDVTNLDFVNYHDGQALLAVHDSDEKLVQILWLLCESQADEAQIAEDEFGAGLGGDSLEQALEALEQALLNFSRPARRQAFAAIRDKAHEVVAAQAKLTESKIRSHQLTQLMETKIQQVSDEIDRRLAESISGNLAMSGLVSSASTPVRSRSGN